jgi:integrase
LVTLSLKRVISFKREAAVPQSESDGTAQNPGFDRGTRRRPISMTDQRPDAAATPIADVVEDYLTDQGKGPEGKSGTYRRDASRELDRFIDFLEDDDSSSDVTFVELDVRDLREYARYLGKQGWADSTVRNYYSHISAFCGWATREGYLAGNIAQRTRAKELLPEDTGRKSGEQQAWSSEQRQQLLSFVDEQAHDAIDVVREDRHGAVKACRDRALVYLLCFSGVRGAEVLAQSSDDRRGRDGLRWADVKLDDNSIQVFAKKQKWDDRALPDPAKSAFEQLRRALDPPSEEWPVFPTLSHATLAKTFSQQLTDRGYDAAEADAIRTENVTDGELSMIELCTEYDVQPPALTTHGGREVLKRLTADAGVDLNDDRHGYLAPHGARRGVGEVLVRKYGHAEAARVLDNSEQIVREHYSHIEAGELADRVTTAFEEHDGDQRVRENETENDGSSPSEG